MPKAEISWKRVTDDGVKLQVNARAGTAVGGLAGIARRGATAHHATPFAAGTRGASAPPDSRAVSRGENLVRRRLDKPGRFELKTRHVHAFSAGNGIVSRRNPDRRLRCGEGQNGYR